MSDFHRASTHLAVARRRRPAGAGCVLLAVILAVTACRGSATTGGTAGTASVAGGRSGRGGRGGSGTGGQPVVTAKVSQKDVPVDIAAVGNVEAYTSVSVRSQVTGQLQETFFHEGDIVKKGDKLFAIDPRPLESSLKQAEANLTRDQALLNQSEAQLARDSANSAYQQTSADRQAQLADRGLVSREALEQSRASANAIIATINADKAAIESAKAQIAVQQSVVDNAKVLLSYAVIRATIDGRTGNNTVKSGNLVTANSTELVTIAQLQPVYVSFTVPANYLAQIKHRMSEDSLLVTATPQDGDSQAIEGRLTFIDNLVDSATDSIRLKATFPNKDLRLWPGQFARVALRLTTLQQATVVPSEAVQVGQDGQFVFVVKGDGTVDQRPITVAQRMGEIVVIAKGLTPGETIVTEGQLRLEQGTRVQTGTADGDAAAGRAGRGGRGGRGGGGGGAGGQGRGGAGGQGRGAAGTNDGGSPRGGGQAPQ